MVLSAALARSLHVVLSATMARFISWVLPLRVNNRASCIHAFCGMPLLLCEVRFVRLSQQSRLWLSSRPNLSSSLNFSWWVYSRSWLARRLWFSQRTWLAQSSWFSQSPWLAHAFWFSQDRWLARWMWFSLGGWLAHRQWFSHSTWLSPPHKMRGVDFVGDVARFGVGAGFGDGFDGHGGLFGKPGAVVRFGGESVMDQGVP